MSPTSLRSFAATAARQRAELWPCTVTLSTDTRSPKQQLPVAKSPARRSRAPDQFGTGYIQRTTAVFLFPLEWFAAGGRLSTSAGYAADLELLRLGTEITIIADSTTPANNGTTWRVTDLTDSNAGTERRVECFRLD